MGCETGFLHCLKEFPCNCKGEKSNCREEKTGQCQVIKFHTTSNRKNWSDMPREGGSENTELLLCYSGPKCITWVQSQVNIGPTIVERYLLKSWSAICRSVKVMKVEVRLRNRSRLKEIRETWQLCSSMWYWIWSFCRKEDYWDY